MGVKVDVFYPFAPLRFVVSLGKPAGLNEAGCQNLRRSPPPFRSGQVKILIMWEENFREISERERAVSQVIGRLFLWEELPL